MLIREEKFSKAFFPIEVTPSGKTIVLRLVHPRKTPSSIRVMPSGMLILVRLVQLLKAFLLMLVTVSGIIIPVKLEYHSKAESPIEVTTIPLSDSGIRSSPISGRDNPLFFFVNSPSSLIE